MLSDFHLLYHLGMSENGAQKTRLLMRCHVHEYNWGYSQFSDTPKYHTIVVLFPIIFLIVHILVVYLLNPSRLFVFNPVGL